MAIIRKYLAKSNYTQADNNVARNRNISDSAKVLYWFMASHKNAFQLNDAFIRNALQWSQPKISRAKKVLKEYDLILIDKIDRQTYFLYIGSSTMSASKVKDNWEELEKL